MLKVNPKNHSFDNVILDIEFSETEMMLAAVMRDNSISFWSMNDNF